MKPWSDSIDPSTIPDEVLLAERARRNSARRSTFTGGTNGGRPKRAYLCEGCHARIEGSREAQTHKCQSPKARLTPLGENSMLLRRAK